MVSRPPHIPLRVIAAKARVSRMTVSLALRNSPDLPAATRRRIQAVARRLGYAPDPLLSEVMSKLRRVTRVRSAITLALVTNEQDGVSWRSIWTHRNYYEGAKEQAELLGYQVEEFCLFAQGMTERRLSEVLTARGIEGGVVLPFINRAGNVGLQLDWSRFLFATCGYSLQSPVLHRSCAAHLRAAMAACRQLYALGYRRVGLALDADQNRRAGYNWTAGYLAASHLEPRAVTVPIHYPQMQTFQAFRTWFRRYRPEAVLHIGREGDILDWIERCGARVPDDVGYAFLDLWPSMSGISGIEQPARQIGAAAIDLVAGGLRQNERGVPEHPKIVLIDGCWRAGKTTRVQG